MSTSRRGPLARLKGPALTAVAVALCALPLAASAHYLTTKEVKRQAVQRTDHGGSLSGRAADVARVRTGRARDRRQTRRRSIRRT